MNTELNAKMAEVMGFSLSLNKECWCDDEAGEILMDVSDWNPSEDVNQALRVLDRAYKNKLIQVLDISLDEFDGSYYVCANHWSVCFVAGSVDKIAKVICLAVAEAYEKLKEEK